MTEEQPILKIEHLSVDIRSEAGTVHAVRDLSLSVRQGEILAVVGESGSGKSILCRSIMGLLPGAASVTGGSIQAGGYEITAMPERKLCGLRGKLFSMVFQDPMMSMDPTMPVGRQIGEALRCHHPELTGDQVRKRAVELMELVGIPEAEARCRMHPWNLSGGMRQRCVLAAALASEPEILIADEPTTALDVTVQAQILDLMLKIREQTGISILFVTHDLGVVAKIADRVAVMYAGKVIEIGESSEIYHDPRHPYTCGLLGALPSNAHQGHLHPIPGFPPNLIDPIPGDAFAPRNPQALGIDYVQAPPFFPVSPTHQVASWLEDPRAPKLMPAFSPGHRGAEQPHVHKPPMEAILEKNHEKPEERQKPPEKEAAEPLLCVSHMNHLFPMSRNHVLHALTDVSFQIRQGEIFSLVGESGSGKSTVAKCLMHIYPITSGQVTYDGVDLTDPAAVRARRSRIQQEIQLILQDSSSALNQRMKVKDIIAEPLKIHHRCKNRRERDRYFTEMMEAVGLEPELLNRYPSQLSGGQRQRVSIARAFAMKPRLLIADEPLAALDVSVQAQIVNLFRHLVREHGSTLLFIAHDLSMVRFLSDRVGVMYRGHLVELADTEELYRNPLHPYTRALLSAMPVPDPEAERRKKLEVYRPQGPLSGTFTEVCPGHFVLLDAAKGQNPAVGNEGN
ncbi:MAG: dipeptide ABC transporter ATP-binding protein [Eubacterium sp.]|jgi:peptide/nickel transport system ATP-binding protein